MIEEMRHGWQMCALLIDFFGSSGKVEAQKMLERRAFENKRLLGTFNVDVDNWLDFFTYTDFVDRDGKFQLQMLKYSLICPARTLDLLHAARRSLPHGNRQRWAAPRGRSGRHPAVAHAEISEQVDLEFVRPLRHGSFILGALGLRLGNQRPVRRAAERQGRRPRRPERLQPSPLSSGSCGIGGTAERLLQPGEKKFYTPDIHFNRNIGRWAGKKCHCETGEPLDDRSYEQHCEENLPSAKDKDLLLDIIRNEKKWIKEKEGARDPLSTIGEPRKSAINI